MQNNWIKSLAVNMVILILVLVTTNLMYETNDDYAIAARIADGYPYVNFINYYLCRILIPMQQSADFNVYVIFQIAAAFASFVFVLKVLLDSCRNIHVAVVAVLVILIFSVDHYCAFQFTKTSALLLMTGMLLLIDSMLLKRRWYYYLYSLLFLYMGTAFRIDNLIAVVGFGGIFLIFWVVWNRKTLKSGGYITGKRILMYILLLGFIGGCYGFQIASDRVLVSTDELSKYKEYSELRSDVVDYPVYEYYSGNEKAYSDIGITENDLYMVDHWYFDYDGAASSEKLNAILDVDSQIHKEGKSVQGSTKSFLKHVISSMRKMTFTGIHVLILILLAIWAAIMVKPGQWNYIIALGVFTVCLYLSLFYMGRPAYRAMYVADLGAALWILYFVATQAVKTEKMIVCRFRSAVSAVVIAALLVILIPVWSDCDRKYDSIQGRIMPASISRFINSHEDSMFIFPVSEKKNSPDYACPVSIPGNSGLKNVMGTGSWGTLSPYILDKLAEYGMENPVKDLINRTNAYYVGNNNIGRLEEYYNRWYGAESGRITLKLVDNIDGYSIWKVTSSCR